MSRNVSHMTHSLDEFSQRCYVSQAEKIDITFSAPVQNRTLQEIDDWGSSLCSEKLIIVPLEIKCLGIASDCFIHFRPKKSFKSGYFALYHKPAFGNILQYNSLANLDEVISNAERYAKFVGKASLEYAEVEQRPYEFMISLFLSVHPFRSKKEKILDLPSSEILLLPSKDDYAKIIYAELQSCPWL